MNIILISNDNTSSILKKAFTGFQTNIISYADPMKAMESIEKIQPTLVIFSATEQNSHWKVCIKFLRSLFTRYESVFLLLMEKELEDTDLSEAKHLGVNAVISGNLANPQTTQKIRELFTEQYNSAHKIQRRPSGIFDDKITFAFINPYSFQIFSGTIVQLSTDSLVFQPHISDAARTLDTHAVIPLAVLCVEESCIQLKIKIKKITENITVEFENLSVDSAQFISKIVAKHKYLTENSKEFQ